VLSWKLLTIFALAFAGAAQTRDTGAVFGTITDAEGAFVPGAQVKLTNTGTGQTRVAQTNASGAYLFSLLPPGTYAISIEHPGFRRYERRGIQLQANENVAVHMALEIGDVQTTITVEERPSQVETRFATVKDTIDQRRVVELPLNGRNAADLALLSTGVTSGIANNTGDTSFADPYRPRGQKQLTVNGSRNNNLRYTLDGGEHMDNLRNFNLPFPFPEALQEFSVQTSNMTVEHGSSSGGAVHVVTKSGTNELHGNAFWFVRNTAINATNFFSRQQDLLKRNQAGFTLGGPLVRNKLFAFGGFQRLVIRSVPGDTRTQTFTAAERRGDFSSNRIVIHDPLTGQPFPNNTIPANRFSPAAQKFFDVSPLPGPDGFASYATARSENENQFVSRFDYVINSAHNLLFRYFHTNQEDPFVSPPNNIHAVRPTNFIPSTNATLGHTWVPGATTIVRTQLTGSHLRTRAFSDSPYSYRDFGVNVYAPSNDVSVSFQNSGASFSAPRRTFFQRAAEEITHDWTRTGGNHTFTWGMQLAWKQYNNDTIFRTSGYFLFDGHATGSGNQFGFDRADFILGQFANFTQNNGEKENRRQALRNFYFGDTWRIRPRFTLSWGVRFEPFTFFTDTKDRVALFDLGNYSKGIGSRVYSNAPAGMLFAGDPAPGGGTIGRSGAESDLLNFAPRLGIAWDPFGNGKTSIRAGYSIFYDFPSLQAFNDAANVAPFSYAVQFNEGLLDDPYRGREHLNRYPVTDFRSDTPFPVPYSASVLDNKYITAYTQNFSLTVEREILRDTRLRVGYVGTKGTDLKADYDQNAPIYNPNLTLAQNRATIDARRPIQGYQTISRFFHGLNSTYHALQVSLDKRYSGGVTVAASYTWSKTLDYYSVNGYSGGRVSNPFNFFFARSVADQHRPHRLVTSFVWDLPAISSARAPRSVRQVLSDWKLSGIGSFQSGRPFTIGATSDPVAGAGSARVDLIGSGNPVLDTNRSKGQILEAYFDKSRFQNPTPNTYGTLGRNALEGPGYANIDASLSKGFRLGFLGEAGLGQFRFDAFNVLNATHLSLPTTGLTNVNFGRILFTDGDPRILQLSLKIGF
jgi:hypothetical protein